MTVLGVTDYLDVHFQGTPFTGPMAWLSGFFLVERDDLGMSLAAADIPARRKLNYLGGMIQLAKLRSMLLAEYGV